MERVQKIACVLQWLSEEGFGKTLQALEDESRINFCEDDCVCQNARVESAEKLRLYVLGTWKHARRSSG